MGDRLRGQDVVHDCVCGLLAHAARYDLPRDGRKLLFRSITNACLNLKSREKETISLDQIGRGSQDGPWELEDIKATPPVDQVIASELKEQILAGLQSLPLAQRSAVELASFGYRAREIAEMLDVSADHARVLLFRGRKAMATFLNGKLVERSVP